MSKLRATIVVEWEVEDLSHYDATTIEEAARNQQRYCDEGTVGPFDLLAWGEDASVRVEPVPEEG